MGCGGVPSGVLDGAAPGDAAASGVGEDGAGVVGGGCGPRVGRIAGGLEARGEIGGGGLAVPDGDGAVGLACLVVTEIGGGAAVVASAREVVLVDDAVGRAAQVLGGVLNQGSGGGRCVLDIRQCYGADGSGGAAASRKRP